jgi:hypothetical protein
VLLLRTHTRRKTLQSALQVLQVLSVALQVLQVEKGVCIKCIHV